jgi:hypothetical protein
MAYIINRYNGTVLTNVEDGTVNTVTELKFIGKNFAGYGEAQNENFLFLLENFANSSAPTKPISGMLWFDSSTQKIKVYDGSNFKNVGGAEVSAVAPTALSEGDLWWDSSTNQLKAKNADGDFILVGPQGAGSGVTQMRSLTLQDTEGGTNPVIAAYVSDTVIFIVSATEFTIATVDAIPGFDRVRKGTTLINTTISTNGVTSSDHRYWGTASNALKLNGLDASDYDIDSNFANRTTPVAFNDFGYTLGDDVDLLVNIDTDTVTPVVKLLRNLMRLKDASNNLVIEIDNTGIKPGTTNNFDLGSTTRVWDVVYGNTFSGTANQADSLKVGSSYRTAATAATADTIAARDGTGNLTAVVFNGTATKARYADLAEKYTTAEDLAPGTAVAVCSHEDHEVEPASASQMCIGVVSTDPAIMMNSEAEGQYIALKGRVPVRVKGAVKKGQPVYAMTDGVCTTIATTALVGVALESNDSDDEKLVECVLKV